MDYRPFLAQTHERLKPQAYLEIGVATGNTLALSKCRSVAIDPTYHITAQLDGDIALFRTSSDEYFSRPDPLAPTGGRPFEFAFIDGLHIFEYALRDFINAERCSSAKGMIIFDDMLPRNVDEAARDRHTSAWTGDVYQIIDVFAKYRPDLAVIPIGTTPTGMLLITGLDPDSTVLADNYAQILLEFRHSDPQPVPERIIDRLTVPAPEKVLQSSIFELLAAADPNASASELRPVITAQVAGDLGPAFAAA
ncbi:class I SAM-dependent methyltransferase [Microlunatus elymi]|uniref:Class I SAM-dependent methyltransferase n=1 Tax=Microlunatus elymi TaxID=2596828 RepID=A0A516Q0C1_9ACTN|nr:class I SAM-dependent methyltransferase [Microlunatus elymi]QDP96886.1 class I SAM-dependent methyltransferase [Microlunatus elymi]